MSPKLMLSSKLTARVRRNMAPSYQVNTSNSRSLVYAALIGEVMETFGRWIRFCTDDYVVIGGIAVSHWLKSRSTTDIDVLMMSIPDEVPAFKRIRPHAFRDNDTHVEVVTLTHDFISLSSERARLVFSTAAESDGVKVASPAALVVLKLQRWSRQDQADIENLLAHFPGPGPEWSLTTQEVSRLQTFQ